MSDNILNMSDKLRGDSTEQFERCQQIAVRSLAQTSKRKILAVATARAASKLAR